MRTLISMLVVVVVLGTVGRNSLPQCRADRELSIRHLHSIELTYEQIGLGIGVQQEVKLSLSSGNRKLYLCQY